MSCSLLTTTTKNQQIFEVQTEIPSLFCFAAAENESKRGEDSSQTELLFLSSTFSSAPPPTSVIPRRLPPLPTSFLPVQASAPPRQIRRNPSLASPGPAPLLPCAPPPPPRVCSRRGGEDPSHPMGAGHAAERTPIEGE